MPGHSSPLPLRRHRRSPWHSPSISAPGALRTRTCARPPKEQSPPAIEAGDSKAPQFRLSWRSVAGGITLVAFAFVLYQGLTDEVIVVEPVQVPPDLAKRGYSAEVVTRKSIDRIRKIQAFLASRNEYRDKEIFAISATKTEDFGVRMRSETVVDFGQKMKQEPISIGLTKSEEFDVRMGGVSALEVLHQAQYLLGKKRRAVTGEIVSDGEHLIATVRIDPSARETISGVTSDPEALITRMAEGMVRVIQPYWWAAYLRAQHAPQAELVARDLLAASAGTDRVWAEVLLGSVLMDSGKVQDAEAAFRHALDGSTELHLLGLFPDHSLERARAQAANNLGVTLVRQGKASEAMKQFELAIRLDSENSEAHFNEGVSLLVLPDGNPDNARKAQDHLYSASRLDPDASLPLTYLARAQFELERYPDAKRSAQLAIERDSKNALAYYWLGSAAERLVGDELCATMAFAKVLRIHRARLLADPLAGPPADLLAAYARRLEVRGTGMLADVHETPMSCFLDR